MAVYNKVPTRAQRFFEKAIGYILAAGLGYGIATIANDIPTLMADQEFVQKLTHHAYPGVHLTYGKVGDCDEK